MQGRCGGDPDLRGRMAQAPAPLQQRSDMDPDALQVHVGWTRQNAPPHRGSEWNRQQRLEWKA